MKPHREIWFVLGVNELGRCIYGQYNVSGSLSQGGRLRWKGPSNQHSEKKLRNGAESGWGWLHLNPKLRKIVQKTLKIWQPSENQNILKPKYKLTGGPVFTFSLPGRRFAPLSSSVTPLFMGGSMQCDILRRKGEGHKFYADSATIFMDSPIQGRQRSRALPPCLFKRGQRGRKCRFITVSKVISWFVKIDLKQINCSHPRTKKIQNSFL